MSDTALILPFSTAAQAAPVPASDPAPVAPEQQNRPRVLVIPESEHYKEALYIKVGDTTGVDTHQVRFVTVEGGQVYTFCRISGVPDEGFNLLPLEPLMLSIQERTTDAEQKGNREIDLAGQPHPAELFVLVQRLLGVCDLNRTGLMAILAHIPPLTDLDRATPDQMKAMVAGVAKAAAATSTGMLANTQQGVPTQPFRDELTTLEREGRAMVAELVKADATVQ